MPYCLCLWTFLQLANARSLGVLFPGLRSPSAVLENSPHGIDHGMPVLVIARQDPRVPPSMALKDAPTGKAYIPQGMIVVMSSKAIALILSKDLELVFLRCGFAILARQKYTNITYKSREALAPIHLFLLSSYPAGWSWQTGEWTSSIAVMASNVWCSFIEWHEVTWNQLAFSRSHISLHPSSRCAEIPKKTSEFSWWCWWLSDGWMDGWRGVYSLN